MTKPADWKTYDEFAYGIATNRLPLSTALDGRATTLILGDRRLSFSVKGNTIDWTEGSESGSDWCEVIEVAPQVFFIDRTFKAKGDHAEVLVLSLASGRAMSIMARIRAEDEVVAEPRVAQTFVAGQVEGIPLTGPEPTPTRDLIGMRAHFTYSPNHVYEHTYLSSQRYCWQNLVGVQRGHGDVDMTSTWKFDDNQYIFTFREFKIAVASTFFYNFNDMRSTGKFLGIDGQGNVLNSPAGAFIRKVSMTYYLPGEEPV
jgi:hypothetical protein